jgi:hypothetical protein
LEHFFPNPTQANTHSTALPRGKFARVIANWRSQSCISMKRKICVPCPKSTVCFPSVSSPLKKDKGKIDLCIHTSPILSFIILASTSYMLEQLNVIITETDLVVLGYKVIKTLNIFI